MEIQGGSAFGKPPVTALQEYCAKKGFTLPVYNCIDADDGTKSFICQVEALNTVSVGSGRSKKEAKHDAAANLIKDVTETHPDIALIPQAAHETIPLSDAVATLRDLCVQNNHPQPIFDLVQQTGPAEAPEFTMLCQLASIKRYGIASNKKAARQKAALKIIQIVQRALVKDDELQVAQIAEVVADTQEDRYKKLKTYRELTESGANDRPDLLLGDRHFFFDKFYDHLKCAAMTVLTHYDPDRSPKDVVYNLFSALKIKPKVKEMKSKEACNLLMIDLCLEYDVVFLGKEPSIYVDIIRYFRHML